MRKLYTGIVFAVLLAPMAHANLVDCETNGCKTCDNIRCRESYYGLDLFNCNDGYSIVRHTCWGRNGNYACSCFGEFVMFISDCEQCPPCYNPPPHMIIEAEKGPGNDFPPRPVDNTYGLPVLGTKNRDVSADFLCTTSTNFSIDGAASCPDKYVERIGCDKPAGRHPDDEGEFKWVCEGK